MNELTKERNEIAKQLLFNGGDVQECVRIADRLMQDMYGDGWNGTKEIPKQTNTTSANFGYNISIEENTKGEKWVRVQALGEDFVVAPKDLDGGKDHFSYDSAKEALAKLGLDTFNRKQGFIIATLIEEINAKLIEAGGDKFAQDVYVSSELWKPVGSSADYNGNNTWYFNGSNGCFNNNNRYNDNFRSRPVLDYDQQDNTNLDSYLVPLSDWLIFSMIASRGKNGKPTYVHFRLHRIERLVRLTHQVNNCELMPTESTAHIIFEPRVREIVCACASKRVVQIFYIRTLQPMLEHYMYHPDSYSCRPGKGSLRAITQLQEYVYAATNGYTDNDCWLAKVDLQAFFMSLDCFDLYDTVTRFIEKHMADSPLLDLMKYLTRQIYLAATKDHLKDMAHPKERALLDPRKSLYNQPYYRGVPIGDWTSQTAGLIKTTGALIYLVSLGYTFVHYTDDSTIVVRCKEMWLKEDCPRFEYFYKAQGLTLHPDKRYFQHYSKGVEMLGYKVRFNRILPSDRIYHNMTWYLERTIRRAQQDFNFAVTHKDKILSTTNSYLGLLRHMTAYKLRKYICTRIEESPLNAIFETAEDYTKITIRRAYSNEVFYLTAYRSIKQQYKMAA